MTTSSEVLKPCPFCGGEAAFGEDECVHDVVFAYCTRCAAQGPFDADKNHDEAASLWNTRAASRPSPTEEMVERVARAIYDVSPQLGYRDRPGGPPANYVVAWEHAAEPLRNEAREQARAALKSMEQGDG